MNNGIILTDSWQQLFWRNYVCFHNIIDFFGKAIFILLAGFICVLVVFEPRFSLEKIFSISVIFGILNKESWNFKKILFISCKYN